MSLAKPGKSTRSTSGRPLTPYRSTIWLLNRISVSSLRRISSSWASPLPPMGSNQTPPRWKTSPRCPLKDVDNVHISLGTKAYLHKLIAGCGKLISPLTKILNSKHPFHWTPSREAAFQDLKTSLVLISALKFLIAKHNKNQRRTPLTVVLQERSSLTPGVVCSSLFPKSFRKSLQLNSFTQYKTRSLAAFLSLYKELALPFHRGKFIPAS